MLDLQVWIESKDGYCKVQHSFYEKLSTSWLVFHAAKDVPQLQREAEASTRKEAKERVERKVREG